MSSANATFVGVASGVGYFWKQRTRSSPSLTMLPGLDQLKRLSMRRTYSIGDQSTRFRLVECPIVMRGTDGSHTVMNRWNTPSSYHAAGSR